MPEMELQGDLAQVREMARRIMSAGAPALRQEILDKMSKWTLNEVEQGFAMAHDPYGMPWAPLKRPRPGGGILKRTKVMSGSVRKRISGDGFKLLSEIFYARFHQRGTRKMVRRRVLPGQLPDEWRAELSRIADEAIRRALEG